LFFYKSETIKIINIKNNINIKIEKKNNQIVKIYFVNNQDDKICILQKITIRDNIKVKPSRYKRYFYLIL
jgi:hypothetical protein